MLRTLLRPNRWEDQCSSEENGPCGVTPPSKYVQRFCFFYSCVYVVQFHLPVFSLRVWETSADQSQSVHLCIVVAIKSSRNEVRVPLLWTNPALSCPTAFILKSCYENIMQICMIQRHELRQYLWRLVLPTEALIWRTVREKGWSKPLNSVGFNTTLLQWLKEDHYFWPILE